MKLRKDCVIPAVAVVLAGLAFLTWYLRHTNTPEYQARQLVEEMRNYKYIGSPGTVERWLIKLGLMSPKENRSWGDIGEELAGLGRAAVPPLIEALRDEDRHVRNWAAENLGTIGPAAKEAIPALKGVLKGKWPHARIAAARALCSIEPPAVDSLIEALKDEDYYVRSWAISAVRKVGPAGDEAIPALIQALKDQDSRIRHSAAMALGERGSAAVPALTEALKDEDTSICRAAAEALKRINRQKQK